MKIVPVALAVGLALGASPAYAATRGACTVLTDPAADVSVVGAVPFAADTHIDVRRVSLSPAPAGFVVRITSTDLIEHRLGEWRVTFSTGGTRLFVGAGTGMWINAGSYTGTFTYLAGIDGKRGVRVRGSIDYAANEIRVVVPYTAFGSAAPARGDALERFAIEAKETFVNVAHGPVSVQIPLVDLGSSNTRYVLGARC